MAELPERIAVERELVEQTLAQLPAAEQLDGLNVLEMAGVASLLHNFYNGVENIIKQVASERALRMPQGYSWHRELLELARTSTIISARTMEELAPYLAFRHFFVHGYAVKVDAERLRPLVARAKDAFRGFLGDLAPHLG